MAACGRRRRCWRRSSRTTTSHRATRFFKYLPNDVRGPIIAAWGIRGIKAALRDDDDKVQSVVYDALVAGDIDHVAFEDGLARRDPRPLGAARRLVGVLARRQADQASHPQGAVHGLRALSLRRPLVSRHDPGQGRLDQGDRRPRRRPDEGGPHRRGSAAFTRPADGTPKGIVAALGWDKIVAKTANEVLIAVLDAMVAKVGLVLSAPRESSPRVESGAKAEAQPEPAPSVVDETSPERVLETLEKPDDGAWSMPPQPGAHGNDEEELLDVSDSHRPASAAAVGGGDQHRPRRGARAVLAADADVGDGCAAGVRAGDFFAQPAAPGSLPVPSGHQALSRRSFRTGRRT